MDAKTNPNIKAADYFDYLPNDSKVLIDAFEGNINSPRLENDVSPGEVLKDLKMFRPEETKIVREYYLTMFYLYTQEGNKDKALKCGIIIETILEEWHVW